METITTTILSMTIGAMVTWLVSDRYYRRATKDLQTAVTTLEAATKKILDRTTILAHGIDGAPLVYDDTGTPVGFLLQLEGRAEGRSSASGTLTMPLHLESRAEGQSSASGTLTIPPEANTE